MALEIHDHNRDDQSLYDECKEHVYYHVILTMRDGSKVVMKFLYELEIS